MDIDNLEKYVESLPVGGAPVLDHSVETEGQDLTSIDLNDIPETIVTGSNLIQFSGENNPVLRSAAALSLLAAQRVASNDSVIVEPKQWIERHNTVLQNLNWSVEGGGEVDSEFESVDVAVHKAILPFLTAAFAPAATAGSLIIKAIEQLHEMDKNAPWITLFEKESRRFNVTEFQFSVVESTEEETRIRLAAARFDASYGRTQILFFKITQQNAKFKAGNSNMMISNEALSSINSALQNKLNRHAEVYIKELDIGEI